MILGDLKELEIPRFGSIAVETVDSALSDAGGGRREGRAGPPVRRGGLGGGGAADQREHRALAELRGVHGARDADRERGHPARPADPDRGRDGRGARSSGRSPGCAWRSSSGAATLRGGRSSPWRWASPSAMVAHAPRGPRFKAMGVAPDDFVPDSHPLTELHLEAGLLLLLRGVRGGRRRDALAHLREVGGADRRADLGDDDPGRGEHRRRRRAYGDAGEAVGRRGPAGHQPGRDRGGRRAHALRSAPLLRRAAPQAPAWTRRARPPACRWAAARARRTR